MWAHLSFIFLLLKGIQQDGGTHEPLNFYRRGKLSYLMEMVSQNWALGQSSLRQ